MTRRTLSRVVLYAQVGYLVLAFGWRSWLQRRRTGDAGFRLSRSSSPPARAASTLMVTGAAAGILGTAAGARSAPTGRAGRRSEAAVVGIFLGILGTHRAQMQLGRSWRIGVDVTERTELVTDGLFRRVRNPIFSCMGLVGLCTAVAVPNRATLLGAALLASGMEVQTRLVEEPYLLGTHPEPYLLYARGAGRFLPGIGRL